MSTEPQIRGQGRYPRRKPEPEPIEEAPSQQQRGPRPDFEPQPAPDGRKLSAPARESPEVQAFFLHRRQNTDADFNLDPVLLLLLMVLPTTNNLLWALLLRHLSPSISWSRTRARAWSTTVLISMLIPVPTGLSSVVTNSPDLLDLHIAGLVHCDLHFQHTNNNKKRQRRKRRMKNLKNIWDRSAKFRRGGTTTESQDDPRWPWRISIDDTANLLVALRR